MFVARWSWNISLSKWLKPSRLLSAQSFGEDHPDLLQAHLSRWCQCNLHGLKRGNQPASLDTGYKNKRQQTGAESKSRERGRRREQSQETEAKKEKKDFVYPWH